MSDDLKIREGSRVLVRGKVVEVDDGETSLPFKVQLVGDRVSYRPAWGGPFWLPASAIHSVEPRAIQVGDRVRGAINPQLLLVVEWRDSTRALVRHEDELQLVLVEHLTLAEFADE